MKVQEDIPQRVAPYEELKKAKLKKKNALDQMMDELEKYEDGCEEKDLLSSGE